MHYNIMAAYVNLSLWTALLIVCGRAETETSAVGAGNEYMDKLLVKVAENESGILNDIRLPGFETNNRDRFLFVNVKVKTSYSNGHLRNLDSVTRLGDCLPETDFTEISCTLQFNDLRVDYNGRMKYGQLPKIGITAKATVRPVEAHVSITNGTALLGGLRLESFELVSPIEIDPAFTGIGLLNRYLKMLKDHFVENVEFYVKHAIQREFVRALNRTLARENRSKS